MPQLLFALLILGLGYYGLKFAARASPTMVAQAVRYGGGALAGAGGLFLILRGRPDLGMAGLGLGLWLAGLWNLPGRRFFKWPRSRPAAHSAARSATIVVDLDHGTGAITGNVTGGPLGGRDLAALTRTECERQYDWCLRDDPEGARLLEAYMNRRFAGWRETRETQGDTGRAGGRSRGASGLSEQEAYEVFGLAEGASREDIVRAHRALMKKLHPDHGGATELAARVNEAREVLLRRFE